MFNHSVSLMYLMNRRWSCSTNTPVIKRLGKYVELKSFIFKQFQLFSGHPKSQKVYKLHDCLKCYNNKKWWVTKDGFCLVVMLPRGSPVTNEASQ